MANAVQFQVVTAGTRRVVAASPSGRPALRSPQAHPGRPVAPGRTAAPISCASVAPAVKRSPWLMAKVAAVGLLAAVGVAVSTQGFVEMAQPDPATQYVAGDPAWAHVNP